MHGTRIPTCFPAFPCHLSDAPHVLGQNRPVLRDVLIQQHRRHPARTRPEIEFDTFQVILRHHLLEDAKLVLPRARLGQTPASLRRIGLRAAHALVCAHS